MIIEVVKSIIAQSETAVVKLANVAMIVTEEENEKLELLPMNEQIKVILSVIGFDEYITEALFGTENELSDEAVALKDEIMARIEAMTDEEKTEFEKMIAELFPIEVVEIDGVEHEYFVVELEISDIDPVTGETVIRYEAYGFRFDEETGEWLLTKISVAHEVEEIVEE